MIVMMSSNVLDKAIEFAVHAHAGVVRKGSRTPYILHPMEAAAIVGSMTDDPEVLAAAMLHDVVEDAGVTPEQIETAFGARVRELVMSETECKREHLPAADTWQIRKSESVAFLNETKDLGVKMLYLGDKLSNLRSICQGCKLHGEAFWHRFNQKDPEKHHWYYRSIANATAELSGHQAWQEFDRLIKEQFGE